MQHQPTGHGNTDWPWKIPLWRKGVVVGYALLDATDYDRFAARRWRMMVNGYASRWARDQRAVVLLAREILGLTPGDPRQADHRNGDRLDNRRANLRIVTHAQNGQNQPSNSGSTSKYRGVDWRESRGKWRARAKVGDRVVALGHFEDEDEAGAAAAKFRREYMPFSVEGR